MSRDGVKGVEQINQVDGTGQRSRAGKGTDTGWRDSAERKKENVWDILSFMFLLAAVSALTFRLFYTQCVESMTDSGLYHSDMKAYILEMQGLDSGYSFPYPVFFKLAAFFHLLVSPECAVALATTVLNGLGIVVTKWGLNRLAYGPLADMIAVKNAKSDEAFDEASAGGITQNAAYCRWFVGPAISLVAVSLFFISMVYPPAGIYLPGIKYNYLGVFTANPFHNATYMAARPFAILAFLWFVKLLDEYETVTAGSAQKFQKSQNTMAWRDYWLFAFSLLAATMTKPSFTIVLVGAAGLIMLYRMFRSGFRNFKATILLGLTFIPTFADLLYQYKGVFVPEDGVEGGMGFGFGRVWSLYCDNIPLAIGLAVGFPLLVLLLHYRELKTDTLYRFSWQVYLMSFVMAFLLYEKGFREPDFNFSWGYMYGIFFAHFGALVVLLRDTAAKKKPLLLGMQWLAYGWHLICGLYYFYGIFQGRMYY